MLIALGKFTTTPGTPVPIISGPLPNTGGTKAHSFLVEALPTNSGRVYVGTATLNRSTLAGVYGILAIPTNNILPTFSATVTYSPNDLDLGLVYIDVDNSGEGALVSCIVV
jgi:hypothetical protein